MEQRKIYSIKNVQEKKEKEGKKEKRLSRWYQNITYEIKKLYKET